MAPARRRSTRLSALALLAGLLAGACLVKDIELVDELPGGGVGAAAGANTGGNSSNAGSPSTAGAQNEGGDDPGAGGTDSGGTDSGGSGGNDAGGTVQGGSAGSNPGGSAGSGQGGSGTRPEIPPGLLSCGDPSYYLCDDFEGSISPRWAPGTGNGEDVLAAPSGSKALIVDYNTTHRISLDLTAVSVSFWVRFPSPTDQRFVSFQDVTTLQEFGLGIEHERARWIYPDLAAPAVAPELNSLTRVLPVDTWACVQIRADIFANTFDATVVVPGDPPVTLPVLDQNPTADEDEAWNTMYPGWSSNNGALIFGQTGVYQEIDDVLIADYDVQTLCEKFVALGDD